MSTHTSTSPATDDQTGRHPVNVGHLVMGVAFLGLATIWALFESDTIGNDDLRWFLPLPWLAAGLAGLLAVALTGRRSRPEPEVAYAAAPTWSPTATEPDPMWAQPDSYTRDRDAQLDADIEAAERDRAQAPPVDEGTAPDRDEHTEQTEQAEQTEVLPEVTPEDRPRDDS